MTNEQLMDIFGFVSMSKMYDNNTFAPRIRFTRKDGTYEDTPNLTMVQLYNDKIDIVNEYLSNKYYLLCKRRNDKIDEILNS
jgi:hypothetical protein